MRLVRSDTSGGDEATVLPNTGLIITWPRFILFRPLPEQTPKLVKVDDDPTRPEQAITELLDRQAGCPARVRSHGRTFDFASFPIFPGSRFTYMNDRQVSVSDSDPANDRFSIAAEVKGVVLIP